MKELVTPKRRAFRREVLGEEIHQALQILVDVPGQARAEAIRARGVAGRDRPGNVTEGELVNWAG